MRYSLTVVCLLIGILIIQKMTPLQCSQDAESFPYLHKFLHELFDSSPSKFDFILQVQVLFCPDQPVCSNYSNHIYNGIINGLPSLEVHNITIEAREISKLIGACCLPCSCDDSCIEDDRCCLSKLTMDLETTGSPKIPAAKGECIAATSKAYFTQSYKLGPYYNYHSMVTRCFTKEGFQATKEYNTTVFRCEQSKMSHYLVDAMIPVTSLASGRTYWNTFCAFCNSDSDDIVSWSARAHLRRAFFYFGKKSFLTGMETFESFFKNVVTSGEFIYRKPITLNYFPCLIGQKISSCDNRSSSSDKPKDRFVQDACLNFSAPVLIRSKVRMIPYKNIFCFFCNDQTTIPTYERNASECLFTDVSKGEHSVMTALLNYKTGKRRGNGSKAATFDEAGKHCSCQSIFDRDKVVLFCRRRLSEICICFIL